MTQGDKPQGTEPMVFKAGLSAILYVRKDRWKTAVKPGKVHGLTKEKGIEKNRNKNKVEMYVSLGDYFEELREKSIPFAARIIREKFVLATRDDDLDEVCLPPHLTKHRCYAIWCWKRGWKVAKKSKALTVYKPTHEFDPRP